MLVTDLCERLGCTVPVIGAPMANRAHGALARAVGDAGGLGMLGVGNAETAALVREQAPIASDGGRLPFGVGLQAWSLPSQPEVLDAVCEVRPTLVSVSFGSPAPHLRALHDRGCLVATQVNSVADAREAVEAGVDVVVAQGTEAGGHTGAVATLPLLQAVLAAVDRPVVAAGGVATGRGLAAVLAAGAQAAWVGTALLACPEAAGARAAAERVVAAAETDTVLTRAFDRAQGLAWPARYPGRALRNAFTARWHGSDPPGSWQQAGEELAAGRRAGDHDVVQVYAGQAAGLVAAPRPAAEVVADLVGEAERCLRAAARLLEEG